VKPALAPVIMRITGILAIAAAACGGHIPETRYYQLAPPAGAPRTGGPLLVVEPLTTEGAYDDDRIVYRTSPYRLDYYQYHRWSAAPGTLIGNYLEQALEHTGKFGGVLRELDPNAAVVLGGRVIAIEEVDESRDRWRGHIALELKLTDARTSEVLWTGRFDESEPLATQSPEGLARALSAAMTRIVARAAPTIAAVAERRAVARGQ